MSLILRLELASIVLIGVTLAAPANAQQLRLTLSEALRLAEGKSEQVDIAQAGVRRAFSEQVRARAQILPQLNGVASYTRTLATQFSGLFDQTQPSCPPLSVNPAAPLESRLAELERALQCGAISPFGSGSGADTLPFGRKNIWQLGFSFAQPVYTGGRVGAQNFLARSLRSAAEVQVDSANAQFVLEVTQAFYDTALAQELLGIAEATLADAEKTLEFTRLAKQVGRVPEFDLLRAQVARNNQLPEMARRRAAIRQSALRLKQLLEVPPTTGLDLVSELMSPVLPVPPPFEARLKAADPIRLAAERAPVRQADAVVQQREANVRLARSQRMPSISIGSDYGLVAYPNTFLPTSTNQFRNDWTVGATLQVPIFNGGRLVADVIAAEANRREAEAQARLTREVAVLDSSIAASQLETAEEQWKATGGTVEEAGRAFEIATLRYREGISSQLELDDARLALQQARVNRAQAARDLQVARATVALLPLLPLSANIPSAPGQPQPLQRNQQQVPTPQAAPATSPLAPTQGRQPRQAPLPGVLPGAGGRTFQ